MDDLISRQQLREAMYHEAFEKDSDLQRWDNGCWIRYKLFENVINNLPSIMRCDELVRCKECKNHNLCAIEDEARDETFFCKWGERRD